MKLAIVSTHPIQYYAPVFRALTLLGDIDLRVFYTWSQSATNAIFDPGFGTEVNWDIPLLEAMPMNLYPTLPGARVCIISVGCIHRCSHQQSKPGKRMPS